MPLSPAALITVLGQLIPKGIILPYNANSSAIPSGWSRYTGLDNKHLYAAGTSIALNATDDASDVSVTLSTDSHGTGLTAFANQGAGVGAGSYPVGGTDYEHEHNHSGTTVIYTPDADILNFIMCTAITRDVPMNALLWSAQQLAKSGLTNWYHDRYLRGTNGGGAVSSHTGALTGTTTESANHSHAWDAVGYLKAGFEPGYENDSAGAHQHTIDDTFAITEVGEKIKKAYLTAWTHASRNFSLFDLCIAMWDNTYGATLPYGWYECDGTNGTVDLRDSFIVSAAYSDSTVGTKPGTNDNTLTGSVTTDSDGEHTHEGAVSLGNSGYSTYHTTGNEHTHTVTLTTAACLPAYYALRFIQKMK